MMVFLLLAGLGDVLVAVVMSVPGSLVLEVFFMIVYKHVLVGSWL